MRGLFVRSDEEGFTTVGTAVALLLVLTLVFACMQAYWVGSRSGQVQYVADAAATAADGAVAEYILYAQTVDAALLSLSLLGLTAYTASVVAAFIPGGASVAASLANLGGRVLKTRDSFAKTARKGLNAAGKALPALCTLRALESIEANSQASGIDYAGVAVPLPQEGVSLELPDDSKVEESVEKMESKEGSIEENVEKRQQAQKDMDEAKERAWRADCGSAGMNMRERAQSLAGLSGSANPNYSSVETWSFSVPLNRAQAYYQARYSQEAGSSYQGNPEELGESVARKRFYDYALSTVSQGSVSVDSLGNEIPDLKYLARNTAQMKETYLYTESIYPVSELNGVKTLHASSSCPAFEKGEPAGYASLLDIDSGTVQECSDCQYTITTVGRVPSASTSIDNGFEYHYRLVVEASEAYNNAREQMKETTSELKDAADEVSDILGQALESLKSGRIDPQPAGRYGCIAIVVAPSVTSNTKTAFVDHEASVGMRVAISGATLAADPNVDMSTVVSRVGAGLVPVSSVGSGFLKVLFGAWGTALGAYSAGNQGVNDLFETVLSHIPIVGDGLSSWATDKFQSAVEAVGLKPAKVKAYKPVLVNTSCILERDDSAFSQSLSSVKQLGNAAAVVGTGDVRSVLETLEDLDVDGLEISDDGIVIAKLILDTYDLGTGSAELTIPAAADLLSRYAGAVGNLKSIVGGG